MKRSLARGVLQERNQGNRILRKGEKVRETVSSGGVFR